MATLAIKELLKLEVMQSVMDNPIDISKTSQVLGLSVSLQRTVNTSFKFSDFF